MKTVLVRDFLKRWNSLNQQTVQVRKRGRIIGTWTPTPAAPKPVDILARLKRDFKKPLPFTGAQGVNEGRRRHVLDI